MIYSPCINQIYIIVASKHAHKYTETSLCILTDLLLVLANQVAIFVFYFPEDGQMINQNM
jgi:hypothetical protein